MFSHRASIAGYALVIIVFGLIPTTSYVFYVFGLLLISIAAIICGVVARGFERIEAAILSRRDLSDS